MAATVAQGVHGRRRVGQGDSFWQYRPYQPGDTPGRIDWRQSAKSARTYVRESEWEAAQTVHLWRDGSASMRWRSSTSLPEKAERAALMLLALASLLLRGGERPRLLGQSTRGSLEAIAAGLSDRGDSLPPHAAVPAHSRVVLIGDFLSPLADIHAVVARLAAMPTRGHLLQILDPAETLLPYAGRVRFRGLEADGDMLIPRVEGIREAMRRRCPTSRPGWPRCAAPPIGASAPTARTPRRKPRCSGSTTALSGQR